MTSIKFNTRPEYLTEELLGIFLSEIFPGEEIIHNRKIQELNFRPDYFIPGRKLIVEFDGFFHYTDNRVISKDMDNFIKSYDNGYEIIRIPYFVQLSRSNIIIYFDDILEGSEIEILNDFNSYPDGFIDKKVVLPGKFSSLGLRNYEELTNSTLVYFDRNRENKNRTLVYFDRNRNKETKNRTVNICNSNIGIDLNRHIWESLIYKFLDNHYFFECFPLTTVDEVAFNYCNLVDCINSDHLEKLRENIEMLLRVDLDDVVKEWSLK